MRKQLTNDEFNAISHLTRSTKLDSVFDIASYSKTEDKFQDFENDTFMSLQKGLDLLYQSLSYPLQHENLNDKESHLIVNLFKEFNINKNNLDWLLQPEI